MLIFICVRLAVRVSGTRDWLGRRMCTAGGRGEIVPRLRPCDHSNLYYKAILCFCFPTQYYPPATPNPEAGCLDHEIYIDISFSVRFNKLYGKINTFQCVFKVALFSITTSPFHNLLFITMIMNTCESFVNNERYYWNNGF